MTPAEAARVVAILAAAYPASRWSQATIEIYESLLSDLDFELARNAVARLVTTSKFLPTIAEIRSAAADVALGPSRSGLEAWGDVMMAIRRVGSYGSPRFADPLVAEAVRVMGWRQLCLGETPEGVDRARFAELYSELQTRQRTLDVSEPGRLLPGSSPRELPANVRKLVGKVGT